MPLFKNSLHKKRAYLRLALYFISFGFVIALLSSLINFRLQTNNIDTAIQQRFESTRVSTYNQLSEIISQLESSVDALAENPLMKTYLLRPSQLSLHNLESLFQAAAAAEPLFMQVRFIDAGGNEQVRVERNDDDSITLVTNRQLQDKSARAYFQQTMQLAKGQHWHSKLDLNREQGQIQIPIRPTYRIATPVYLDERVAAGVVIININAQPVLSNALRSEIFNVLMIDREGETLAHFDDSQAWSRYLPERESVFAQQPALARALQGSADIANNYLVEGHYALDITQLFPNGEGLLLLFAPKQEAISTLFRSNYLAALLIAMIVLLISFPLSWLVALIPAKLQNKLSHALSEVQHANSLLDRHVISSHTDTDGVITDVSQKMCDASGYSKQELIGKTHRVLAHPKASRRNHKLLWQTITEGETWNGELYNRTKDGRDYWIKSVISPDLDQDGQLIGYTQVAQDISSKKALEKLSVTDTLTGVYNRRKLDQLLAEESDRLNRFQHQFSVILLDLDGFKQLNDTYGHLAGDDVLVRVAGHIQRRVRQVDQVGRWGGEEFLIICPGTDGKSAALLADKLRVYISQQEYSLDREVTASFGVAEGVVDEGAAHMIKRADDALYQAKQQGRNRVVYQDPDQARQSS